MFYRKYKIVKIVISEVKVPLLIFAVSAKSLIVISSNDLPCVNFIKAKNKPIFCFIFQKNTIFSFFVHRHSSTKAYTKLMKILIIYTYPNHESLNGNILEFISTEYFIQAYRKNS